MFIWLSLFVVVLFYTTPFREAELTEQLMLKTRKE